MFSIRIIRKFSSNESKVSYNRKCIRHCSSYKAELTAAGTLLSVREFSGKLSAHLRKQAGTLGIVPYQKEMFISPEVQISLTAVSNLTQTKPNSTQIATQSQPHLITRISLYPVVGSFELWTSTHWLRSFLWVSLQTA